MSRAVMDQNLMPSRERKSRLIGQWALLALAVFLAASPAAGMGAFPPVVISYWEGIIASYWWDSREAYHKDLFDHHGGPEGQNPPLLPGEKEPVGLTVSYGYFKGFAPADPAHVTCADFRVIHLDRKDPLGKIEYPSRRSAAKSAVLFTGGGWLYGIGHPSWMHFWVAAMLPDGAEPLFNPDGMGLNPKVLARPIIAELGSLALENMSPEKMRLVGITHCEGFDIYDVTFRR